MSGSADRKMSHRDLVHLLKRRPMMSRLVMASPRTRSESPR